MSALSIFESDRQTIAVVTNPIFLTSDLRMMRGAEVTFEVFETDANRLENFVGTTQLYYLDGRLFWAALKSLEPSQGTHPGLSLLRDKPTLRGVFLMHGDHSDA